MKVRFASFAIFRDLIVIHENDRQLFNEFASLAEDAAKDPTYHVGCGREPKNGSKGLGKPERLTGNLSGKYSRRIDN